MRWTYSLPQLAQTLTKALLHPLRQKAILHFSYVKINHSLVLSKAYDMASDVEDAVLACGLATAS